MPRLSRRQLLEALAASGAAGLAGCGRSEPAKKDTVPTVPGTTPTGTQETGTPPAGPPPNIVYIYADQHRSSKLGCYGHEIVLSPNIDALANEGIVFENMFTNSTVCRPARMCMMTGQYPHTHTVWHNGVMARAEDSKSHVRRLRDEAGYHTAVIGKTHLYEIFGHPSEAHNFEQLVAWGFDYAVELVSQPSQGSVPNAWADYVDANTATGETPKSMRYAHYEATYDYFTSPGPDQSPWFLMREDHIDVFTGDLAAQWIRDYDGEKPFYLQVNFPGPHKPFDATQEYRDLYELSGIDVSILGPPGEPRSDMVEWIWGQKGLVGLTPEESRLMNLSYYAKISMVDEMIGEVVQALKDSGHYENTWIVYSSDHGELLGDHEIWGKVVMFEGSIRIPLVIRPPGGVEPWRVPGLVDQLDMTSTLLQIAGLEPESDLPGRSLYDQILGGPDAPGAADGKSSILSEVVGDQWGVRWWTVMLRREQFKLVYDLDTFAVTDLYDLVSDPEEKTNLVDQAAHADTQADMLDELLGNLPEGLLP